MKPLTITVTLLLLVFRLNAAAESFLIGVSPYLNEEGRKAAFASLTEFVLAIASAGDSITVLDAWNLRPITSFALPKEQAGRTNVRERALRFKVELAQLKEYLLKERPHAVELTSMVRAPQFLEMAGTLLRKPEEHVHILVIGSPCYTDPDIPAFSMSDAVPSDAHLHADPSLTIFSTVGRAKALKDAIVLWAFLESRFANDFQRGRIARWWFLYIQEQQGVLAFFGTDIRIALQRAKAGVSMPCMNAVINPADTKLEMRQVVFEPSVPRAVLTNRVAQVNEMLEAAKADTRAEFEKMLQAFEEQAKATAASAATDAAKAVQATVRASVEAPTNAERVTEHIATREPAPQLEPPNAMNQPNAAPASLVITIVWSDKVDFDLWVKPDGDAEEIGHQHAVTERGRYFSSAMPVKYERVELYHPVNFKVLRCWVNYFSGLERSPRCTALIQHGGRVYQTDVSFSAFKGDKGRDAGERYKSKAWVELDLTRVLGVEDRARPVIP